MIEGGCFCGAVRYAVSGEPRNETVCHCVDCRRVAASPCVAWFTAGTADVRFTGQDAVRFASSSKVTRAFCPSCGTMLTYAHADTPGEVDIAIASLDDPGRVPPKDHVWVEQKLAWVVVGDRLPRYDRSRTEP